MYTHPAEAPLTVRSTPLRWKVCTRTEAVAALRIVVDSLAEIEAGPSEFELA